MNSSQTFGHIAMTIITQYLRIEYLNGAGAGRGVSFAHYELLSDIVEKVSLYRNGTLSTRKWLEN